MTSLRAVGHRALYPTPTMLLAGILVVGMLGLAALVWTAKVQATLVEDRATARATALSLCGLLDVILPRSGEPQPETERGRLVAARMRAEYDRLHCTHLLPEEK